MSGSAVETIFLAAAAALLLGACSAVPGLGRIDGGESVDAYAADSPERRDRAETGDAQVQPAETARRDASSPLQSGERPLASGGRAAVAKTQPQPAPAAAERLKPSSDGACGGELLVEEQPKGDSLLAVVEGLEIRASDIYRTFFLENPLRTRNAIQNEILYILTRKESLRLGVTVDASEVEKVLERTIEDHRARCAAYIDETVTLEKFVELQYGMPFEEYRALLRRTAVFNLLLDRCVRFQEMTCRRFRLGVIVVDDSEEAAGVRQKLLRGANLEVLAEKHSLDRSASEGGVLAPIPGDARHPLHPLVESAARLGVGEVTEIEETSFGSRTMYRIVKLIEIIEPIEGNYQQAAAAVRESIEINPVDLASIQYWQECQRERYAIEVL